MNSRNAWFWAFTAAFLLLALVGYERLFHRPPQGPVPLLPGFRAAEVDAVQVLPADVPEILVRRTNEVWELKRPLAYPAQANSIEALLQALETVVPATVISGADLRKTQDDQLAYGLEPPRASLIFSIGGGRQQLLIGSLTAPGDQVFVQVVGGQGISVIDAELLKLIPVSAGMWRDTRLFDLPEGAYDTIRVTAAERGLELKKDPTSQSWQIVHPMQARADDALLGNLIQGLNNLSVRKFVSDDPRADRDAWGLQPADLEIAFAQGTNEVLALQFGKPVNGVTNAVYAVGRDPSSVVVVAQEPLQAWVAPPNDFRDRQLLKLSRAVTSIEVSNGETFTLVNTTNSTWRVEPLGIPADVRTVRRFLHDLQALRVSRFVKDVVAEPDLPEYGLETPAFQVTLHSGSAAADQPASVIGLEFGSASDESVFVRRADENAVYALDRETLAAIPAAAGHFRQLNLWNFAADQVASVTVGLGDATWKVNRDGLNQWSLAAGSQGMINAFAVEEAVHLLGQLEAVVWTDWSEENLLRYGIEEESVAVTVELKDGSRKSVRFGFSAPSSHVYAATALDGGSWVFEFPAETFALVQSYLITPSNLL